MLLFVYRVVGLYMIFECYEVVLIGKGCARRKPEEEEVLGIGQNLSEEIVERSLFEFKE